MLWLNIMVIKYVNTSRLLLYIDKRIYCTARGRGGLGGEGVLTSFIGGANPDPPAHEFAIRLYTNHLIYKLQTLRVFLD